MWPLWQRIGVGIAVGVVLATLGVASKSLLANRSSAGTPIQRSMTVYATGNGQRATIVLPDGTHVVLNVASRLEIPANYAAGNRTVRLRGAALFSVAHRDGAAFTVLTGATATRVLGTSFVVRHYATDSVTTVSVRDGRVGVRPNAIMRQHVVDAGQQAQMSGAGGVHIGEAKPSQFTFAVGVLTIDGLPLSSAIVELDRWYDTDIRVSDPSLASMHIRGEFAAGSRADLAAMLEWTLNVRVVQDGRVLTLYRK
jgi:ferric-dicitrate binding protein FerR (iron transport regulator)